MVMDTQTLKTNIDLRHIVERDLGQAPIRSGRASLYKCPFHKERKGYSLAVWADGYHCFGACDTSGDLFDWLMNYRQISFTEAIEQLGTDRPQKSGQVLRQASLSSEPPANNWQRSAREVVEMAEETRWSSAGEPALNYLVERGLTSAIIRDAQLGYIPGNYRDWRELSGLHVPCGITIPWFAADALWAVKVRRATGFPKYVQIAGGSSHGLYGADYLPYHRLALFCEGEFDVLIARQEVGKWLCPVSLGSASNRLPTRWHSELSGCRNILVAYDNDAAGAKGAEQLLKISPRFRALKLPFGKDISDFYLHGGDVYEWLADIISDQFNHPERIQDVR
jgi:DNA primase